MPTYVFKGRNRLGEVIVGERPADSREVLRQLLRREQVMLTSVKEKGREIAVPKIGGGRKKVKAKELAIFTRQFSVMIDAGLPLVQCLEILAQQQDSKNFAMVLTQTRQDVEEGSTLAAAMARHPKVFDQLFVNMVEAGEAGGLVVLGVIVAAVIGIRSYYKTPKGQRMLDGLMLKIPIFGMILRKIAVARFSRTLSTLLSSGVPILQSLDITARTAGNVILEED